MTYKNPKLLNNRPVSIKVSVFVFLMVSFLFGSTTAWAVTENIAWTSLDHVYTDGTFLRHDTEDINGSAMSSQFITLGDGFVGWIVNETSSNMAVGLNNGSINSTLENIDFGIRLNGASNAEIWENGVYKLETTYTANDVFRVAVVSGQIKYSKNGVVFYTSTATPAYPLYANGWLTLGSTVKNATISYTTPTPTPTNPGTVSDLNIVSITSNDATLSFTEVNDGTETPAKYDVRYDVPTISWGSAPSATSGTCAVPLSGTAIGVTKTCTVTNLLSNTQYQFQLVPYRGTLTVDAIFGGLSNIVGGTTNPIPTPDPTTTPSPTPVPDTTNPIVQFFDVQPKFTKGSVTVSWAVTDFGGSFLNKVKINRAPYDVASCSDTNKAGCAWALIKTLLAPLNQSTWFSSTADAPAAGTYFYGLHAVDNANNRGVESYPVKVVIDKTVPMFSSITITNKTPWAASINWITNEPANGQVEFCAGTIRCGMNTPIVPDLTFNHTISLSGLNPNTTYYYWIKSRDEAGNLRISSRRSFTTLENIPIPTPTPTHTPTPDLDGGLSSLYPGDIGIENDPSVVFVEKFEEATISDLASRWGDIKNPAGNITFSSDIPFGSPAGGHSINVRSNTTDDGGYLYKVLTPGINDTLYVRYYIKYPLANIPHHSGIWVGGFNPSSAWPDPQSGSKPSGNDRFITAAEQNPGAGRFDHYNYWMGMHPDGNGSYWGNNLLNDPGVQIIPGQWTCVEEMVKLNNPTTAYNGEHALWLNGVKVSHLGQGFPNGSWGIASQGGNPGIFTQDPLAPTAFEGFRWRSDPNLNLNWLWLQNYSDNLNSNLVFDHVVVAKSYIGCLR